MTKLAEYPELVRSALDLKPDEARKLVERLIPILDLERITETAPKVSGGRLAMGFVSIAAGVGVQSYAQILNPAGSGAIVAVEQVIASIAAGGPSSVFFRDHDTALTSLDTNLRFADRRQPGAPVAELRKQQTAAIFGIVTYFLFTMFQEGSFFYRLPEPIILEAGEGLIARNGTTNEGLHVSFAWREIAA